MYPKIVLYHMYYKIKYINENKNKIKRHILQNLIKYKFDIAGHYEKFKKMLSLQIIKKWKEPAF
jgi:hypothetical protein